MKHKIKSLILITLVSSFFIGCGFQKVQYTNRTQLITIGYAQEMKLGLTASEKIKKENYKTLNKDKKFYKRVYAIGTKIAKVANKPDFRWEFNTISKDIPNAFCLPGGKVFVYKGILKAAKNDDQLATVISHEIAHAIARHGAERASINQVAGISGQILSAVVNSKAPEHNNAFAMAYGYGLNYGLILPYSRKHELEADKIGLIPMTKAGYDTNEAYKFWKNMAKSSGRAENANDFFSTHPNSYKRMEEIKKFNAMNQ